MFAPSPEEADQREAAGTRCRSLRGCCGLGAAAQREGAACRRQGLCGCCGFGPVVGSSEAASVAVPCEGAAAAAAIGRILALPSQRHRLPWFFRGVRDQACLIVPLECCRAEIVAQSACLSLQLPTAANGLFPWCFRRGKGGRFYLFWWRRKYSITKWRYTWFPGLISGAAYTMFQVQYVQGTVYCTCTNMTVACLI